MTAGTFLAQQVVDNFEVLPFLLGMSYLQGKTTHELLYPQQDTVIQWRVSQQETDKYIQQDPKGTIARYLLRSKR